MLYAINPNDFDIDNNVKRFLNPNTSVFDMKNILRFLTRKRVDIATAFYFFLDSYEEPEVEKNKSLILLEILKHHNNYKISLYKEDKKSTEKYLYILFKLGIVKNWTITYSSASSDNFKNVDFDIELNYKMNDINHIREQALKYVQAYQSDDGKNVTESEQLFYNKIKNIDATQLGDLILEMRKWYHSLFITTRREQIANMYQMIKDFANKGPTIEIQNVIDRFFNIKDSIGKTSEGFDLVTFEGAALEEVVDYAFLLKGEDLIQRKYEMQVVLQSNVNAKNSVYTSLVHLRLDEFKEEHNGDERFDYAFSLLNENERLEVTESIIKNYNNLEETQKIMIIDKLKNYDQKIIHKLYEKFSDDQLVNEYAIAYINSKFDESWV